MTTEQGNKLIAEFMNKTFQFEEDLKYHSNWNSLMPVVEKIENLNDLIVDKVWISINGRECGLWTYFDVKEVLRIGTENNKFKVKNTSKSKIESTWRTVIDFIEWYNKNNHNE